ncbi:MAG TPA: DUF6624 domain-containing protein [Mucilaginibacter sp.]|nr:DUF6624 domain-containing protein [Mucilaginibacter sp.]
MKKIIVFLTISAAALASHGQSKHFNQPLADSLAKWVIIDQTAAYIPQGNFRKLSKQQWEHYKDSVFSVHKLLLEEIFKKYGFPGYDLVGKQGSNNFWLMVQHCDKTPEFQLEVLEAMKAELKKNNADSKNFAYLTDRVNLNTGKKQLYGTQVTYRLDSCQAIPKPLADSLNVNIRRKDVGLEPIENYLNMMSQMHFEMNKAVYEARGIHHPKLLKTGN